MSEDKEPEKAEDMMVDDQAGAEAFAAAEGHDGHHALVGVEKEAINVGLVFGIILGTVVVVLGLIFAGFSLTDVKSRQLKAEAMSGADYPELREVRAASIDKIDKFDVVDGEEGVYKIPVDHAIDLMVNEAHEAGDDEGDSDQLKLK